MFYVSKGKIYLAEPENKGYPEVELVQELDSDPYLVRTGKYLSEKPADRVIYSYMELLTKFEPKVPTPVKSTSSKK